MVNGISSNFYVSHNQINKAPSFQARPKTMTSPIDEKMNKGLEMLGIYNMSLVKNKENFEHEPAELILPADIKIDDAQGEKIYAPDGKLDYVVNNDGNTETRYYPMYEKPEQIGSIEVRDFNTGRLIKEQYNSDYNWIDIFEHPENEPDVSYRTLYRDGKVESVEKEIKLPNGSTKTYHKNISDINPSYNVSVFDRNYKNSLDVSLDSQNNVSEIYVRKNINNVDYSKSLTLNKGAVIGIRESKDVTIPNFMERDILNDVDVIPTEKFDKNEIERIAKQNPEGGNYSFWGNGSLKEMKNDKLAVEFFEDGSQIIKEYMDDNAVKISHYRKNGEISCDYKKDDLTKSLCISSENKPEYYSIDKDGKNVKSASFSPEGYLVWAN